MIRNHSGQTYDDEMQASVVTAVIQKRAATVSDPIRDIESGGKKDQGLTPLAAKAGMSSIQDDLAGLDSFGVSDPDGTIKRHILADPITQK